MSLTYHLSCRRIYKDQVKRSIMNQICEKIEEKSQKFRYYEKYGTDGSNWQKY